jgi:hypothetical protein
MTPQEAPRSAGSAVSRCERLGLEHPIYAGESVARIEDVRPAGHLVRTLAGAPSGA